MKSNERERLGMDARKAWGSDRMVLDALTQDIDVYPEVLRPIDAGLMRRLRTLVACVEVDLERSLPPELDDAGMPCASQVIAPTKHDQFNSRRRKRTRIPWWNTELNPRPLSDPDSNA